MEEEITVPKQMNPAQLRLKLQHYLDKVSPKDPLTALRLHSKEALEKSGLPQKNEEPFAYLPLSSLYNKNLEAAPQLSSTLNPLPFTPTILFINGHFIPSKSDEKIGLYSLEEALLSYNHYLKSRFQFWKEKETDPFVHLNGALHPHGAFLYLPPEYQNANPVHIVHLITDAASFSLSLPRLHIVVGRHAEVTIHSHTLFSSSQGALCSSLLDLSLEEGSKVNLTSHNNLSGQDWHFQALRVTQKKDSRFVGTATSTGGQTLRASYHVILKGEGADTSLNGLWILNEKRQAHTYVIVEHEAPHCHSSQLFKSILSDLSRTSFEGKILVHKTAKLTDAFQRNHNLLLSPHVMANSKPNLEIYTDEVKASHGATSGLLDPQIIFYLRSRGLTEEMATDFLINGFAKEILDLIPSSNVKEHICFDLGLNHGAL